MEEGRSSGVVEARSLGLVEALRSRTVEAVVRNLVLAEGSRVADPDQDSMTL